MRVSINGSERKSWLGKLARGLKRGCKKGFEWGYHVCYIIGVQTMRAGHRILDWLSRALRPVGQGIRRAADWLLLRHVRAAAEEIKRFGRGFPEGIARVRQAASRHVLLGVLQALLLPVLAVKRHRRALVSVLNLAAPVAAVCLLVVTVQYWSNSTFALELEFEGERLGYISDAAVFDEAVTMANARINNVDNSFEVTRTPKLTLAMVNKEDLLDETAVCDKILRNSSDSIAQVSALYIDGKFEGALASRDELDGLLNEILFSYCSTDGGDRASFLANVQVENGLYPISSVVTAADMRQKLTATTVADEYYEVVQGDTPIGIARAHQMTLSELQSLNETPLSELMYIGKKVQVQKAVPYLQVQVKRTVQYTETINFSIVEQEDSSLYKGVSKTKTAGKTGERIVTAEVTLVDGVEQSRTVLDSVVTKQPVDQVVLVGTKARPSGSGSIYTPNTGIVNGDGQSHGRFVYPVPAVTRIYQKFHRGHSGVDFSSGSVPIMNQKIVAVDGGTVVEVNTNKNAGYGLYVVIDHGNGLRTLYAHCNSLSVVKGQKVSQGQEIARVGRTGNSTGPHLHFEVRVNGRCVDPEPYFK